MLLSVTDLLVVLDAPLLMLNVDTLGVVEVVKLKVAVTVFAASIVTVQDPVPEHEPLHPPKVEPEDADAVKVTEVPLL